MERLQFNRYSRTQRFQETGAAAHMSLHHNQQCQRAESVSPPFDRGTGLPMKKTQTRLARRPCPVGETAIYGGDFRPSIAVFEIFRRSSRPDDRWQCAVAPSVAAHMSTPTDSVNTLISKNFSFGSFRPLRSGLTPLLYEGLRRDGG